MHQKLDVSLILQEYQVSNNSIYSAKGTCLPAITSAPTITLVLAFNLLFDS